MPAARRHHYQFGHVELPGLFYADPKRFISTLQADGIHFLQYVWRRIGENLSPAEQVADDGLQVDFLTLEARIYLVLITLPPPVGMTEAYFVGAVYRPPQTEQQEIARFFTLELSFHVATEQPLTIIGEWTVDHLHRNLGAGPVAKQGEFVSTIQAILSE